MFMGEYQHSIDEKGRLTIPAKFRDRLGSTFIITRGLDNCLFVYPDEEWEPIAAKLKALPLTRTDARAFTRLFLAGAVEIEMDKQGRINIPNNLLQYANIKKECIILGVSNRVEVWSLEEWENYITIAQESFGEIAEKIVDLDV